MAENSATKISLKEAREILGKDAEQMTDEALQKLLDQLNSLARDFVQMVLKGDLYAE